MIDLSNEYRRFPSKMYKMENVKKNKTKKTLLSLKKIKIKLLQSKEIKKMTVVKESEQHFHVTSYINYNTLRLSCIEILLIYSFQVSVTHLQIQLKSDFNKLFLVLFFFF